MFDHTSRHETKLQAIPDAALEKEPRLVEVPGYVFWLRPSDLLRIEVRIENDMGFAPGVTLYFSDGTTKFLRGADSSVAAGIAVVLWPARQERNG